MAELRLKNSIVDDRYLVDRCLGRGSYAEIFLASDESNGRSTVIIKALNAWLQGTPDPDLERTLIENFQNEAIALDKVRHPNIIRRLGHGTAADLEGKPFHYLLLEYMPGGDLLALCRKRVFKIADALFYFQQVAEALAYAHSCKVIHRDMKPNNLLLSADHRIIKIADFGVAKMALDDNTEITRVGTNIYAPPEHHPDSPVSSLSEKLTPSADIYSLAKTIYTSMTGRAPRQFARRPIEGLPVELRSEAWSGELLRVLMRATQTQAADRYQSAQEFWEDFALLNNYLGESKESDPEATLVRPRLSGTSSVERAAARPQFQTLAVAPNKSGQAQKARIVVELPHRPPQPVYAPPASPDDALVTAASPQPGDGRMQVSENGASVILVEKSRSPSRATSADDDLERTVFDDLRAIIRSEWLRRIFVAFLVVALIGFVASTYFYFADHGRSLPSILGGEAGRDGAIANALNVNMRSEPWGAVLAVLPEGTRVRVVENQNGWARVIVLRWVGDAPANAPDGGWVDGQFVKYD